jgi:hypothetical protein
VSGAGDGAVDWVADLCPPNENPHFSRTNRARNEAPGLARRGRAARATYSESKSKAIDTDEVVRANFAFELSLAAWHRQGTLRSTSRLVLTRSDQEDVVRAAGGIICDLQRGAFGPEDGGLEGYGDDALRTRSE